jgi:hypothetical protein
MAPALDVTPSPYRECMAERLPSLDLIASLVEVQQDHQLRHFDGLDNKAGIMLGFAGVLVAIADGFEPWRSQAGSRQWEQP